MGCRLHSPGHRVYFSALIVPAGLGLQTILYRQNHLSSFSVLVCGKVLDRVDASSNST